ncbi:MAG: ATP-binding cassette domain-containing protein [Bacteroidetes bacterium]|jgi:phospholipid/cholesterol/gamma-HCH transport system ATP-binding protein|nr:ATP-binding cassette domain-containing protein [Bacteroidota bacterium]
METVLKSENEKVYEITQEVVIEVRNIDKSFGKNNVLKKFSMDLHRGENVVVLGKSGSGKSVLIKCIIGLLKTDAGTIKVLNDDISNFDRDELDLMRVKVGFLFQSNALYDSMTVRENLEFPLRRHGKEKNREEVNALVLEALTAVRLAHTIDMMPSELSGGMRKRIALARTLILKPEIILYDEPTTGLDPVTGKEISQLMVEVQKKYNTSSVIISHDVNCVKIVANRIVLLIDGMCYTSGTYSELSNSEDPKVKQFFT